MSETLRIFGKIYKDVPGIKAKNRSGDIVTLTSGGIDPSVLATKADLVSNPVAGDILVSDENGQPVGTGTDITELLDDVDTAKKAFMLWDFQQYISVTIPSVTTDISNTQIPSVDINLPSNMTDDWAIAALAKYEVHDSSGRINAFQVCSFSLNQQSTLRLRMMVGGTVSKNATEVQGALLLKHR